jgi:murein DD-endopeptidase MepM/ murein hydrolase activator NlpD
MAAEIAAKSLKSVLPLELGSLHPFENGLAESFRYRLGLTPYAGRSSVPDGLLAVLNAPKTNALEAHEVARASLMCEQSPPAAAARRMSKSASFRLRIDSFPSRMRATRAIFICSAAAMAAVALFFLIAVPSWFIKSNVLDSEVAMQSLPRELFDIEPKFAAPKQDKMTVTMALPQSFDGVSKLAESGAPRLSQTYEPTQSASVIAPANAVTDTASAGNSAVHVVVPGDTLRKISGLYSKPIGEIVKANNIAITTRLNVGDRIIIPGVKSSAANRIHQSVAQTSPAAPVPQATEATPSASVFTPTSAVTGAEASKAVGESSSLPKFRWPTNGRVISAFGPMTNGQQNDGINIAVSENTPVKAAEDGTVAYAGNELKGYGNLILVRHPNGYVTAYAHAKELLVKQGDQVKRGQIIARSGRSGSVNTPQLHFEIRKGSTPVDPTKLLNGE